eukprot:5937018-Amphidinium_carterae.1
MKKLGRKVWLLAQRRTRWLAIGSICTKLGMGAFTTYLVEFFFAMPLVLDCCFQNLQVVRKCVLLTHALVQTVSCDR